MSSYTRTMTSISKVRGRSVNRTRAPAGNGPALHWRELDALHLRAVLDLLADVHEAVGPDDFARVLMTRLGETVQADMISYNEIEMGVQTSVFFEPQTARQPQLEEAFTRLVGQHPLVRHFVETDDPTPQRLSDFISDLDLRRLDLYQEVFRPLETNHQLGLLLSGSDGLLIGLGVNRRRRDFSDCDLAVVEVLQPHLSAAFEHAVLRQSSADRLRRSARAATMLSVLTPREREVATLIAAARSNRQIARTLLISQRTAENHVANVLRKLAVPSRASAIALLREREELDGS